MTHSAEEWNAAFKPFLNRNQARLGTSQVDDLESLQALIWFKSASWICRHFAWLAPAAGRACGYKTGTPGPPDAVSGLSYLGLG